MIKKGAKSISSIMKGNKAIQYIYKGTMLVYQAIRKFIVSGVFPLTLTNTVGSDLTDYKIEGNSVHNGSDNLFDKTTMINGFLPTSGAYPTINSSYPNALYQIIDMKAGQTVKISYSGSDAFSGRIRCIDNDKNEIDHTIVSGITEYYTSTASYNNAFYDGEITAKKDFKLGVMYITTLPTNFDLQIKSTIPTPEIPVEVVSVGEKSKNLLNHKKIFDGDSVTISGITYAKTNEGIMVNGTSTNFASTGLTLDLKPILEVGKTYIISGSTLDVYVVFYSLTNGTANYSGKKTITGEEETISVYLQTNGGTTVSNVLIKPQLEEGEVATEYEPYGYKIPIISRGKNLIKNVATSKTSNGITFTVNEDKSVTINGTNTKNDTLVFSLNFDADWVNRNVPLKTNTNYVLSGGETYPTGVFLQAYGMVDGSPVYKTYKDTPIRFKTEEEASWGFYLMIFSGVSVDNLTIYPQLEEGDVATEYEPYQEPITTNIYLDEPLRKVKDYADYIDFKNQKVVRQIHKINLGDYEWMIATDGDIFYYTHIVSPKPAISEVGNSMCNVLTSSKNIGYTSPDIGIHSFVSGIVRARPDLTVFDTLEKWQEYVNTHEAYLLYPIESIEETITLPSIPTLEGTTILDSDVTVEPSYVEVEYTNEKPKEGTTITLADGNILLDSNGDYFNVKEE